MMMMILSAIALIAMVAEPVFAYTDAALKDQVISIYLEKLIFFDFYCFLFEDY